ncbi:YtxH domain-containing protein [Clostridium sp. WILCCON 0269]|uniref:YtxH domain-containing protein n=1 Tax=Candidatus Clostridium eludens TaxID=3381663 RepID=A0ABW8SI83_9CLOT
MSGKFVAGAIIGTALGMMIVPELDKTTMRRIKRTSRYLKNAVGNVYGKMSNFTM